MKRDLKGQKFGRLTPLYIAGTSRKRTHWMCRCDCGNEKMINTNQMTSGKTQSCGCFQRERSSKSKITHGLAGTKVYRSWALAKSRCTNPKSDQYRYYGGRGIKMCEKWLNNFEAFLFDMGHPPSKDHSLDRIDVDGDYTPENCRWATFKEQCRNRRSNTKVSYQGVVYCLTELCEMLGLNPKYVASKVRKDEYALETLIPGAQLL